MATLKVSAGLLAILFLTISPAESATHNVASCSLALVQAAVDGAADGDIVAVPAGDCTWTSGLIIPASKNIVLQGAGMDLTVIRASSPGAWLIGVNFGASRVTAFTFECGYIGVDGEGWRIDHNKMTCSTFREGVLVRGNRNLDQPRGLVDHNVFINQRVLVQAYPATSLAELDSSTLWSDPLGLGTEEAVYVEDNIFNFTIFGNAVDCNYGGRYVFRYNTVTNTYLEAHSVQGTHRACRKWEIYENTITQSGGFSMARWMLLRGGTGVVYNNTMSGTVNTGSNISIDNVRTVTSVNVFGRCDGTSLWDGNTPGQVGWPCRDQIGRGGDMSPMVTSGYISQLAEPAYFWANIVNGQVGSVQVENGAQSHIQADRDYVTNKGPKPGYTPFAYPHPLTMSQQPQKPLAPTNLKVVPSV